MAPRWRRFIEIFNEPVGALIAIAAFLFLVASVLVYLGTRPPPSDSELIERFEADRAAFERLVDIVRLPSQIDTVWTSFRDERWSYEVSAPTGQEGEEASRLMSRLGIDYVVPGSGVTLYTYGGFLREYQKGYYYLPPDDSTPVVSAADIVESLDGLELGPLERKYRILEDRWFLFKASMDSD